MSLQMGRKSDKNTKQQALQNAQSLESKEGRWKDVLELGTSKCFSSLHTSFLPYLQGNFYSILFMFQKLSRADKLSTTGREAQW